MMVQTVVLWLCWCAFVALGVVGSVEESHGGGSNVRRNLQNAPRLVGLPDLGPTYRNAYDELVSSAARAVPIPASQAAFTYRRDPATGEYVRTTETFGPVPFLERPQTLGEGAFNVAVSGQYLELDEFDGERVGADPHPILVGGQAIRYSARPKIVYHVATVQATYGVLDDLDLNLAVPIAAHDFDLNATRQSPAGGPGTINTVHSHVSLGVMDILLRAKYQLTRFVGFPLAGGFVARLPTGDNDRALGSGDAEFGPYVYVSNTYWGRVEPHFNAGFNFNLDAHQSSAQYGIGTNVQAVKEWVNLTAAFLGRHETDRRLGRNSGSGLHLTPTGPDITPYGGLEFDRKDYFDVALGAQIRLYKTLVASVNVMKAVNDDGLRSSEWSPFGVVQATF